MSKFYIYQTWLSAYRNSYVLAEQQNLMSWETAVEFNYRRDIPLAGTVPTFNFQVKSFVPHPDVYWVTNVELYSKRMLDVVKSFDVPFEEFDAKLFDKKTGEEVLQDRGYKVFRLRQVFPYAQITVAPNWTIQDIEINEDAMKHAPHLFINTVTPTIFASEEFKKAVETQGITGCRFSTIEAYLSDQSMRGTPVNTSSSKRK